MTKPLIAFENCYAKAPKFLRQRRVSNKINSSDIGGLEDVCWPLVPKYAGSNPAEAVGFFRAKKSPANLPSQRK
jgi:hypothetical protein